MKKLVQFLFLFQISINAFSQNLSEEMNSILTRIGNNTPADQLFLHTDRNLYQSGDTIRFQAYIRDFQTGVFETGSISLHALLLNPEHITIDSARFRISYSTASGWLKVPDNAPLGFYTILAFTSDQMNYDSRFAFRMTIKIDRLRPVRSDTIPDQVIERTDVDLRFLPEGGTYIYGVRQRLAFNAVTSTGKSIKISGDIVNQDGKKITEFKQSPYGPGVVEFTPVQGESYYAKPVEPEFGNMNWPLPEPEKSGISMRVNNTRSGSIDMILRGRETSGKKYFLTVTMNNILIFSRDIQLDTLFSARIKTDEIPSGTAIVTLYDNDLNPVAERLVFLNQDKKMNVVISTSPVNARPGKETEVIINTTNEKGENVSSFISVSVVDSTSGYYNGMPYPDIESAFLYDREFYNNLPYSIRCHGLKNIDSRSIDMLMMTYGWRKYTIKETELVYQKRRPDNYDHLKIINRGKEKKVRSEIRLVSTEGGGIITLGLDENRETILPFDSLDVYAREIMILPDDDPSRNSNPVSIEFPENKVFTEEAKLIKTDSGSLIPQFTIAENEQPLFNQDSAVMIEPVTIKGNRKKPSVNVAKTAENYKYTGAITLYSRDFEHVQYFEDILYKLGAYNVDKKTKKVVLRAIYYMPKLMSISATIPLVVRPALFVVDNVPVFDRTYYPIAQMLASEIASITVLKGPQGFAQFGNDASNGVIMVTTKIGNRINGIIDPNDESKPGYNLVNQVRVFRTEVEYYIPTKEQVELVPEYQLRPTLLWKSDVYLDGSGPIKFEYPNNLGNGTVLIFVNGVSLTNLVGSNRFSYKIK